MKTYKVLKDFPSSDGGFEHKVGKTYKPSKSETRTKALERLGYIEELPEQPKTVWDLKEGENYYYIDWLGNTGWCFRAREEDLKYMRRYREVGNCFLSLKEAEKELARRKAKQILLRDTKWFNPDWSNCSFKYYVFYDYIEKIFRTDFTEYRAESMIYFATIEDAKDSIRNHSNEWKTYLGIEDGIN